MWLLPIVRPFASAAMRTFYQFEVAGEAIPSEGGVLLVANHPNMAADAGGVIASAPRPVRFLAKAPLFENRFTGWGIRGVGALPLYRRQDDPSSVARNEATFDAVRNALEEGWAVAVFPEGISHDEPSLSALKTGAARIALSTAAAGGPRVPIVPVGMTYRFKSEFRSRALALVGPPVRWEDLAGRPESDADAVRELTRRIEESLRKVTVNLERWEDAPAVLIAEAIEAADQRLTREGEQKMQRVQRIAAAFTQARSHDPGKLLELERDLLDFNAILRELRLSPATLEIATRTGVATRWMVGRLLPFLFVLPFLALGVPLFWIPYRLTAMLAARFGGTVVRATLKILGGFLIFLIYMVLLSLLVGIIWGWVVGLVAFALLPFAAAATSAGVSWWKRTRLEARRFLILRRDATVRDSLLARRHALAARLAELTRPSPERRRNAAG